MNPCVAKSTLPELGEENRKHRVHNLKPKQSRSEPDRQTRRGEAPVPTKPAAKETDFSPRAAEWQLSL